MLIKNFRLIFVLSNFLFFTACITPDNLIKNIPTTTNTITINKLDEQSTNKLIYTEWQKRKADIKNILASSGNNLDNLDDFIKKKTFLFERGSLSRKEYNNLKLDYFAATSVNIDLSIEKMLTQYTDLGSSFLEKQKQKYDSLNDDTYKDFKRVYTETFL